MHRWQTRALWPDTHVNLCGDASAFSEKPETGAGARSPVFCAAPLCQTYAITGLTASGGKALTSR
jgi:hypothetical protein